MNHTFKKKTCGKCRERKTVAGGTNKNYRFVCAQCSEKDGLIKAQAERLTNRG
jgi:formylmethanofuran dehydrogenase subunit E